jgi:hypothetical protein
MSASNIGVSKRGIDLPHDSRPGIWSEYGGGDRPRDAGQG